MAVQGINDFPVLRGIVLELFGRHQVFFGKRFKSDEETVTPTFGQQFHILDRLQPG